MLRTPTLHALAFVLCGCALTPEFPAPAAPGEPEVQAFDARGEPSPLDRLPRRPRLSIALAAAPSAAMPSSAANNGPWLLTGAADDALLDDLEKLPLTVAHQARSIALQQRWDGQRLQLEPLNTLDPGAMFTLALPRKAATSLPRAFTAELRVDDSAQAGATIRSTFPAAETAGVPSDLALALVGFDGEVQGFEAGIWLENSEGLALPAEIEAIACDSFDSAAASCVRLELQEPLQLGSRYQLRSGRALQDAHGAAVEELRVAFSTQTDVADTSAPWQRSPCDVDQQELPIGCLSVSDSSVELSLFQNPAQRVVAHLAGDQLAALANAGAVPLRFAGLLADTLYMLDVDIIDARMHSEAISWELRTAPVLPLLVITEVNADPNGAEPDQEYVELWNFGETTATLAGLCLSDSPRDLGMALPEPVSLAPSARALLVSDAYDPADTLDQTPAPGSLIVRVGKSVTRGGLANSGERLFLRTCDGVRLSSAPAQPAPREGKCLVRQPSAAEAVGSDWALSDCTPGR